MDFDFTDEQLQLRDAVAREVRARTGTGHDDPVDCHPSLRDEPLALPAAPASTGRQDLLQPLLQRV